MAESALMQVEMASLNWQNTMNENQQITAVTVNQAASLLMNLYQYAEQALDWLMGNSTTNPSGGYTPYNGDSYDPSTMGKPTYTSDSDKQYSNNVNIWETFYNEKNQDCQNVENAVNTPTQALDQQESSLGNTSQEAAQIAGTVAEPNKIVANLLQSSL
jgi:hypothetical protein